MFFQKKRKLKVILLNKIPDANLVKEIDKTTFENEKFSIVKDCLYFYSLIGYGRTKFNMNTFEEKLNVSATLRNYNTIKILLELV